MKVRLKRRSIRNQESISRQEHQRQENIVQNRENGTLTTSLSQLHHSRVYPMTNSHKTLPSSIDFGFPSHGSTLSTQSYFIWPSARIRQISAGRQMPLDQLYQRDLRGKPIYKGLIFFVLNYRLTISFVDLPEQINLEYAY